MPKISVIIPVYNTERYLPACLTSILGQSERDLEILAVNNGCTDRSPKILEEYSCRDKRIKVITIEHGEVCTARNVAISVAKGDFLAFCDSDDTVPPDAYALLLHKASRQKCDVVVGAHYNMRDDGETEWVPVPITARDSTFQLLLSTPCVWNKLIRRTFLETHQLSFPNLIMGEDVIFLILLLKCSPKTAVLKKPVYCYWHHTEDNQPSMTHRYTLSFFRLHLLCREQLLRELADTAYQRESEEYVYCGMCEFLRVFLFRIWDGDERREAFELFRKHMFQYCWEGQESRFEQLIGIMPGVFRNISAEGYISQAVDFSHRDKVLQEYRAGQIGFRYILRYIQAWIEFKIKCMKGKMQ